MQNTHSDFLVYRHIRLDTNMPFYVGKGTEKGSRATSKINRTKYWKSIVDLVGYRVDIIAAGLTNEQAIEKEIEFIALYGRQDLGLGTLVNLTDGGEGRFGHSPSQETREKIGNGSRGIPKSASTKAKMSEAAKGQKHWLGKKHKTETKEKISNANKGRVFTKEHRKSISKAAKNRIMNHFEGKRHSTETKMKQSLLKIGKTSSEEAKEKIRQKALGRKISVEQRLKMIGRIRNRKVIDDSTGIIYESVADAYAKLNFVANISSLRRWLNGANINQTTLRYV